MSELLDIVDLSGRPTGETVERETAHRDGILHRTSHVWILRHHEGVIQILLQLRSDSKDAFPGCYDISSAGHIPAGEDFLTSAVRELKEELGVSVNSNSLNYCGHRLIEIDDCFHGIDFHDRQFSNIYVLWLDRDEEDFVLQEEEISSVKWMDFYDCYSSVSRNSIKHCIDLGEIEMVRNLFESEFV
ncbi:MAG: NUDIX domain-containing protein [Clostridia bacterium]|nr:NUDIX domain-containing protein [Clostridia bacterium]